MQIITRHNALEVLHENVGKKLSVFADQHGITRRGVSGKVNKGWKGLTCEAIAGLSNSNKKAPNGLGYEIKSVPYCVKKGLWVPKETMAITMLNTEDLLNCSFFKSCVWEKLKSLIFCMVSFEGQHSIESTLLKVKSLDLMKDDACIKGAEEDYEFIRDKLRTKGYEALTAKDGNWIQARTKGAGHGSKTRAFYAKTAFLLEIFPPFPAE